MSAAYDNVSSNDLMESLLNVGLGRFIEVCARECFSENILLIVPKYRFT